MPSRLEESLIELRAAVAPVRLPLPLPGARANADLAGQITKQLDDYILPRLATIDAPLLTVVGGSTGAGKSTLVNSLVGRKVTTPGVIRPTTRAPVLVFHPDDAHWFTDDRILPGLARVSGSSNNQQTLQLVTEETLPRGLAILDAPDVDSVVEENRRLAAQLLAAADLWLFVTSAARYADAVPWDYLLAAVERSAAVGVVLQRVPPGAMQDVPPHLGQMMVDRGLGESPLFAVPETTTDSEGLLPDSAVSPIRTWLATLARDSRSRQEVVHRTLDGAIGALTAKAPLVAVAIDDQVATINDLRAEADHSYAEAVRTIGVQTADGTLLRGEVLARWHEFVGTGELFRKLDQRMGWLRDRVVSVFRGEPAGAKDLKVAVESGMEALLREEGAAAAERVDAAWRAHPAGRELLKNAPDDLSRPSPQFAAEAGRMVRDWQGGVLDLVSDEGMSKRSRARFLALGVNGVGAALMVVVFAHTGGLTGAEVGVAGGATVLAQRVLEAVFGDDAVRRLAKRAKEDLDSRVEALMSSELVRYHDLLAAQQVEPGQAERITAAVAAVETARQDGLPDGTLDGQLALPGGATGIEGDGRAELDGGAAELEPAEPVEAESVVAGPVAATPERAIEAPEDGVVDAEVIGETDDAAEPRRAADAGNDRVDALAEFRAHQAERDRHERADQEWR